LLDYEAARAGTAKAGQRTGRRAQPGWKKFGPALIRMPVWKLRLNNRAHLHSELGCLFSVPLIEAELATAIFYEYAYHHYQVAFDQNAEEALRRFDEAVSERRAKQEIGLADGASEELRDLLQTDPQMALALIAEGDEESTDIEALVTAIQEAAEDLHRGSAEGAFEALSQLALTAASLAREAAQAASDPRLIDRVRALGIDIPDVVASGTRAVFFTGAAQEKITTAEAHVSRIATLVEEASAADAAILSATTAQRYGELAGLAATAPAAKASLGAARAEQASDLADLAALLEKRRPLSLLRATATETEFQPADAAADLERGATGTAPSDMPDGASSEDTDAPAFPAHEPEPIEVIEVSAEPECGAEPEPATTVAPLFGLIPGKAAPVTPPVTPSVSSPVSHSVLLAASPVEAIEFGGMPDEAAGGVPGSATASTGDPEPAATGSEDATETVVASAALANSDIPAVAAEAGLDPSVLAGGAAWRISAAVLRAAAAARAPQRDYGNDSVRFTAIVEGARAAISGDLEAVTLLGGLLRPAILQKPVAFRTNIQTLARGRFGQHLLEAAEAISELTFDFPPGADELARLSGTASQAPQKGKLVDRLGLWCDAMAKRTSRWQFCTKFMHHVVSEDGPIGRARRAIEAGRKDALDLARAAIADLDSPAKIEARSEEFGAEVRRTSERLYPKGVEYLDRHFSEAVGYLADWVRASETAGHGGERADGRLRATIGNLRSRLEKAARQLRLEAENERLDGRILDAAVADWLAQRSDEPRAGLAGGDAGEIAVFEEALTGGRDLLPTEVRRNLAAPARRPHRLLDLLSGAGVAEPAEAYTCSGAR